MPTATAKPASWQPSVLCRKNIHAYISHKLHQVDITMDKVCKRASSKQIFKTCISLMLILYTFDISRSCITRHRTRHRGNNVKFNQTINPQKTSHTITLTGGLWVYFLILGARKPRDIVSILKSNKSCGENDDENQYKDSKYSNSNYELTTEQWHEGPCQFFTSVLRFPNVTARFI